MELSLDAPYHPPPPADDDIVSPYDDLKVSDLPPKLDYSWKMKHGIIDLRDEDNNLLRSIIRPDTHEFLETVITRFFIVRAKFSGDSGKVFLKVCPYRRAPL